MAPRSCPHPRGLVLALAVCLAPFIGCGGGDGPSAHPTDAPFDLTGVPLSDQLAQALRDDDDIAAGPDWVAELALADELEVAVQRPATRDAAGDRLYAVWRESPRNLLWIETAVRYDYLLHRGAERDTMIAALATGDDDPVGSFARGVLKYGRGARGEEFRAAAARADELDDLGRVRLGLKLAMVEVDGGDPLSAVDRLLALLPDCAPGGPWLRMRVWYDTAHDLWRADRLDDALHATAAGWRACIESGSDNWRGRYLILRAGLRRARRENGAAMALYEEASRLGADRDLPWIRQKSAALAAGLCSSLGDAARALELDRLALAASVAIADSLNTPRCLVNIADDHRMLGELDSSLVYVDRARHWVDAFGDARNRAHLPIKAAELYCHVGDYARADSLLELARSLAPDAGLATDEADLLLRMLKQGVEMGQPDLAYRAVGRLAHLRGVIRDRGPDLRTSAEYETAVAGFLAGQGEYVLASEALERAEAAVARGGGEETTWRYHRCRGELALARGDMPTAEAEFTRGLELARRIGNASLESASRFHLGHHLLEAGRPDEARALFSVAADSARYGARFRLRLETLACLGRAYALEDRFDEAEDRLRRAVTLLTPYTPPDLSALVHYELGMALAARGEREAALRTARDRLDTTTRASSPELEILTGNLRRDIVHALLDLHLRNTPASPGRATLRSTLALALTLKPAPWGDDPVAQLTADGAGAAVYLVGETRSYVWVATARDLEVHELPGRPELSRLMAPVLAGLGTPLRDVDDKALDRLSEVLLGPVLPAWPSERLLRIVPDDLLATVPWSALTVDPSGTPAVAHGPLIEMESPGTRGDDASTSDTGPLLAVGLDSHAGRPGAPADLHHAEAEARAVAALWPADRVVLRTGAAADWPSLLTDLPTARVVHLATHAVVHQGASERASLRLASDAGAAPVALRSLADLDLQADLIYLSCCEGARTSRPGAGLTGFARAFLAAGARTVVASTIRVDDEASSELARLFYTRWRDGADKASALRHAQLALRETDPAWAHPYYWSFYRIIGAAD